MNIISTKVHGAIDYVFAILLIASPWIFGYDYGNSAAFWVPIVLGAMSVIISVCTNYELGLFKVLDMRMHLLFDAMTGITLALSPWIFYFYGQVSRPHLLMGTASLLITLLSSRYPYARNATISKMRESVEEDRYQTKAG
jgi:hypothetical protein